jgi:hypothetical protein
MPDTIAAYSAWVRLPNGWRRVAEADTEPECWDRLLDHLEQHGGGYGGALVLPAGRTPGKALGVASAASSSPGHPAGRRGYPHSPGGMPHGRARGPASPEWRRKTTHR